VPLDDFMKRVQDELDRDPAGAPSQPLKKLRVQGPSDSAGPSDMTEKLPAAVGKSEPMSFFEELKDLIEWRTAGYLTDSEFAAAKQKLGLN